MKIKTTLTALLLIIGGSVLSAQSLEGSIKKHFKRFQWRAEVGLAAAGVSMGGLETTLEYFNEYYKEYERVSGGEIEIPSAIKFAPRLGVMGDYELKPNVFLSTGLEYKLQGLSYTGDVPNIGYFTRGYRMYGSVQLSLHYLNLPIMVGIKKDLTKDIALRLEGGLYLAYAFSGKSKGELSSPYKTIEEYNAYSLEVDVFNPNKAKVLSDLQLSNKLVDYAPRIELSRLDYGINLGVGMEYQKKYLLRLSYEQGLNNIISPLVEGFKIHPELSRREYKRAEFEKLNFRNYGLSIRLGYRI